MLDAITTLITTAAVAVALWVGLEPRRIQKRREIRLAGVAASILQREVGVLLNTGILVASPSYSVKGLLVEDSKARMLELIKCPLLKGCIEKAYEYPEEMAYEMGNLYGIATVFELRLIGFGRQEVTQDDVSKLESLAFELAVSAKKLQSLLISYTPATNRSVSNTPSDSPADMPQK